MEPTEQLSYILPTLCATVDRIQTEQLNNPTACTRFMVQDVLNHMIVLGGSFSYLFRGEPSPEAKATERFTSVPAAEFRKVMENLLDAVKSPGAMERTVSTPLGEMVGSTFARLVAFDGLIHGWDLATATGLNYEPPPAVIASVDEFARSALTAEMRDGDTFKNATVVPDNATPLEQLVAFSGRTV